MHNDATQALFAGAPSRNCMESSRSGLAGGIEGLVR